MPKTSTQWDYKLLAEKCQIQKLILPTKKQSNNRDKFSLAFLEFSEKTGELHDSNQLVRIKQLLNSHKNKFVVVFVHGWRHNASIGNGDVRRFRTLLAYSKKFLKQRNNIPKNTELIGIYVGWRGSSVTERGLGFIPAVSGTLWSRKAVSEAHAPKLISVLDAIQETMGRNEGSKSFKKMLVLGHSLGGNMLITGLKERALQRIENHKKGTLFTPLIGDLVLLINPASEAEKWIALQKKLRESMGVSKKNNNPSNSTWRKSFPLNQKPVLISLTATDNWPESETLGVKAEYDWPTAVLFPLAHFYRFNKKQMITIGHYNPDYPSSGEKYRYPQTDPYGATHELILNKGPGKSTRLSGLLESDTHECIPATGWLMDTRTRANKFNQGWAMWDSGSKGKKPDSIHYALLPYSKKSRDYNSQFRRGLSLPGVNKNGVRRSMVPRNSPFWNTRVLNSIKNHGGYVSYAGWCLINQMVLDDITYKP